MYQICLGGFIGGPAALLTAVFILNSCSYQTAAHTRQLHSYFLSALILDNRSHTGQLLILDSCSLDSCSHTGQLLSYWTDVPWTLAPMLDSCSYWTAVIIYPVVIGFYVHQSCMVCSSGFLCSSIMYGLQQRVHMFISHVWSAVMGPYVQQTCKVCSSGSLCSSAMYDLQQCSGFLCSSAMYGLPQWVPMFISHAQSAVVGSYVHQSCMVCSCRFLCSSIMYGLQQCSGSLCSSAMYGLQQCSGSLCSSAMRSLQLWVPMFISHVWFTVVVPYVHQPCVVCSSRFLCSLVMCGLQQQAPMFSCHIPMYSMQQLTLICHSVSGSRKLKCTRYDSVVLCVLCQQLIV